MCSALTAIGHSAIPSTYEEDLAADLQSDDYITFSEADQSIEKRTISKLPLRGKEIQIYIEKHAHSGLIDRRAAYHACSHLIRLDESLGFLTAQTLAETKLKSEKEREEGVAYLTLLLNKYQLPLAPELVDLAIDTAAKMFHSQSERIHLEALSFFNHVIEFGKTGEYEKLRPTMIGFFKSDNPSTSTLLDQMLLHEYRHKSIPSIALQAVVTGCASEHPFTRGKSIKLFSSVLSHQVEGSIQAASEVIRQELSRKNPRQEIFNLIKRMKEDKEIS